MKTTKNITLGFYQNLGKLFYAIAAADEIVREEEIDQLKNLVSTEWLAVDELNDDFGTDAAYQIDLIFEWLSKDKEYSSKECYKDFVSFKKDQHHLFTKEVNPLILKTANAIAESFSRKNKLELMLLAKLHMELLKK